MARAAAPTRPGDARPLPGGETRQRRCSRRHPRPCARGWPPGPGLGGGGSPPFLPLPLAFLPSASSRGTPASRGPGVPSVQPGALAPPARPRCLLKVTRRGRGEQGTPARAAAHPSARGGARPGRPCCRLLPPQSRLLNQRGAARPPPPAPRLPQPRLAARAPPTPGREPQPPRHWLRGSACLYISPGALEWSCIKRAATSGREARGQPGTGWAQEGGGRGRGGSGRPRSDAPRRWG